MELYKLKVLWDELDLFRPLPICSCASKCTCDALVNVSKYKAQDQIIKFLLLHNKRGKFLVINPRQ